MQLAKEYYQKNYTAIIYRLNGKAYLHLDTNGRRYQWVNVRIVARIGRFTFKMIGMSV
jgi:hypothetical protein